MTQAPRSAFTLVQLVLAVFVMALLLRVLLHDPPQPEPRQTYDGHRVLKQDAVRYAKLNGHLPHAPQVAAEPSDAGQVVEVVPPGTLKPGQGPLLARVLRSHRPSTTDRQVDALVDTLPPNASPSVIVIIPQPDKPEAATPEAEKCAPADDPAPTGE